MPDYGSLHFSLESQFVRLSPFPDESSSELHPYFDLYECVSSHPSISLPPIFVELTSSESHFLYGHPGSPNFDFSQSFELYDVISYQDISLSAIFIPLTHSVFKTLSFFGFDFFSSLDCGDLSVFPYSSIHGDLAPWHNSRLRALRNRTNILLYEVIGI